MEHAIKTNNCKNQFQCDILIRENKITLLVITLVVIFLICHTPNAVYLVYKLWWSSRHSSSDEMKMENFIIGENLFSELLWMMRSFFPQENLLASNAIFKTSLKAKCLNPTASPILNMCVYA